MARSRSVQISAAGKVVVENKTLRKQGSGAASGATQALVRTHNGKRAEKWGKSYQVIKDLGRGAYGMVTKVQHKLTKEPYAMKAIDLSHLGVSYLGLDFDHFPRVPPSFVPPHTRRGPCCSSYLTRGSKIFKKSLVHRLQSDVPPDSRGS